MEDAKALAYPYRDGDTIVLGPQTFINIVHAGGAAREGDVISYRGENFVRQEQPPQRELDPPPLALEQLPQILANLARSDEDERKRQDARWDELTERCAAIEARIDSLEARNQPLAGDVPLSTRPLADRARGRVSGVAREATSRPDLFAGDDPGYVRPEPCETASTKRPEAVAEGTGWPSPRVREGSDGNVGPVR